MAFRVAGASARIREAPEGLASGLSRRRFDLCDARSSDLDQPVHIVGDVGDADLRLCSEDADSSDREGHWPLLVGKDVLHWRPML